MSADSATRELVLVAGSGRSGTSLTALALKALGAHVPQPEVAPNPTNPAGFGEPQWLVDFHTTHLSRAGRTHVDPRPSSLQEARNCSFDPAAHDQALAWLRSEFELADMIVLKDPRLTWFIDLWAEVGRTLGARVSVVRLVRDPVEVVASQIRWYQGGRTPDFLLGAWIVGNRMVDRHSPGLAVHSLTHRQILENPVQAITTLTKCLDLQESLVGSKEVHSAIAGLTDPTREHSQSSSILMDDLVARPLLALAGKIFESLEEEAMGLQAHDQARDARMGLYESYTRLYAAGEALSYHSQPLLLSQQEDRARKRDTELREAKATNAAYREVIESLRTESRELKSEARALRRRIRKLQVRKDELRREIRSIKHRRIHSRLRRAARRVWGGLTWPR